MPRTTVRYRTTIGAPATGVFPLVADYRSATDIIEGLESLSPLQEGEAGIGARFGAVMRLGPKTVETEVELAELVHLERVTWAAAGGDERRVTFELMPVPVSATEVRMTVSYLAPDGLPGLVMAPVVEETVRAKARHTLHRLKELCETDAPPPS